MLQDRKTKDILGFSKVKKLFYKNFSIKNTGVTKIVIIIFMLILISQIHS